MLTGLPVWELLASSWAFQVDLRNEFFHRTLKNSWKNNASIASKSRGAAIYVEASENMTDLTAWPRVVWNPARPVACA